MIASSLKGEARRGLNRWFMASTVLLTLGLVGWIIFTYLDEVSTAQNIVANIIANRSTTFNEVFLQRDLEQFTSARNAGLLTPIEIHVSREGAKVASVGPRPWLGLYHDWEVATVVRGGIYQVRLGVDVFPSAIFYFVFLGGIALAYRVLLHYTFSSFDRAVTAVANEFDNVISELKGERSDLMNLTHTEFDELRRISRGWKAELENYRNEVARLSTAEAESRVAQLVAHDIKSPLSVLRLVLNLPKPLGSDERALLLQASDRITQICEDLVQISRDKVARPSATILSASEIKSFWTTLAKEKKIEFANEDLKFPIRCNWPLEAKIYCLNPLAFRRVVSNLVNNSIQAGGKSISLELVVDPYSDALRLEVHDDGPGIPESVLSNLNSGPVTGGSGTGLGLKSARAWVESINGALEIASRPAGGTVVSMVFNREQGHTNHGIEDIKVGPELTKG